MCVCPLSVWVCVWCVWVVCVCVSVCVRLCVCVWCVCAGLYVCMNVCAYMRMSSCMYVFVYVLTCINVRQYGST